MLGRKKCKFKIKLLLSSQGHLNRKIPPPPGLADVMLGKNINIGKKKRKM
jgi:hypothetical protein